MLFIEPGAVNVMNGCSTAFSPCHLMAQDSNTGSSVCSKVAAVSLLTRKEVYLLLVLLVLLFK